MPRSADLIGIGHSLTYHDLCTLELDIVKPKKEFDVRIDWMSFLRQVAVSIAAEAHQIYKSDFV